MSLEPPPPPFAPADAISALLRRVGAYSGHGINHEDEPFHGELDVAALLDEQGVTMKFRAVGIDGTVYQDERIWVATDDTGAVGLWSIHTNGGGVRRHSARSGPLSAGAERTLHFGFGDVNDRRSYRQELTIDLWPGGDVSYRVSWGLPGGDHRCRSDVRMRPDP